MSRIVCRAHLLQHIDPAERVVLREVCINAVFDGTNDSFRHSRFRFRIIRMHELDRTTLEQRPQRAIQKFGSGIGVQEFDWRVGEIVFEYVVECATNDLCSLVFEWSDVEHSRKCIDDNEYVPVTVVMRRQELHVSEIGLQYTIGVSGDVRSSSESSDRRSVHGVAILFTQKVNNVRTTRRRVFDASSPQKRIDASVRPRIGRIVVDLRQ